MGFSRVYVDSNIFIRAFEGAVDDTVATQLEELFELSGRKSSPAFVTSQITLAEMLVQPIRANDLNRQLRYHSLLSTSNEWLEVRPVSLSVLVDAAGIRGTQKLKLPDAIHAATARQARCNHILTADADFGPEALTPTFSNLDGLGQWLRA